MRARFPDAIMSSQRPPQSIREASVVIVIDGRGVLRGFPLVKNCESCQVKMSALHSDGIGMT